MITLFIMYSVATIWVQSDPPIKVSISLFSMVACFWVQLCWSLSLYKSNPMYYCSSYRAKAGQHPGLITRSSQGHIQTINLSHTMETRKYHVVVYCLHPAIKSFTVKTIVALSIHKHAVHIVHIHYQTKFGHTISIRCPMSYWHCSFPLNWTKWTDIELGNNNSIKITLSYVLYLNSQKWQPFIKSIFRVIVWVNMCFFAA